MNQVTLSGRLVKAAESRKAPAEGKRGLFSATIAVDGGKNPKGEKITYFFDLYGNYSSEKWLSYLTKGKKISVGGTLFYLDTTSKEGKKYRNFYVRAMTVDFEFPESSEAKVPEAAKEEDKLNTDDMPF